MAHSSQNKAALLHSAAERSIAYLDSLDERSVFPSPQTLARLAELDIPLPEAPTDPEKVLAQLDETGSPATVASAGGRYYGFVTGGSLPAALAANWLAGAWDQAADMVVASPIGAKLEEVAIRWLLDVLGLPPAAGVGFVTGATMANFCGLAAARHAVLQARGWDVESRGLFGAPEITVIVGEEVHVSLLKALSLLGLGYERVVRIPVDGQGSMRADAFSAYLAGSKSTDFDSTSGDVESEGMPGDVDSAAPPVIVCLQAGNVNTGAFDPAAEIIPAAHEAGGWVHVDGAFGLWAAAAPARAHLTAGYAEADSWAVDAHKWLNVPYDSGMVICREEAHLRSAMRFSKVPAYLAQNEQYEPGLYTPEMSRRARGVEIWAALLSLGRSGLADLIERNCRYAQRFAQGLAEAGYTILNCGTDHRVDLNQVMVSFGSDEYIGAETTQRVIAALQAEGDCWCGGTVWQGKSAMRISVSSWATTPQDVERSLEIMIKIAKQECKK